jgi:hypothetical protein
MKVEARNCVASMFEEMGSRWSLNQMNQFMKTYVVLGDPEHFFLFVLN